uniref:Uncharacterized protein n=1 Tax=viral metagenome TaxID=1070528 RepID=A0A6C0HZS8_9ZZZZ
MAAEIRYDVIVVLEGHGCYNTQDVGEIRLCRMVGVPEGMEATFLEAVPCGVTNFSEKDWAEKTIKRWEQFKDKFGPTRKFAYLLREYLKEDTLEHVKETTTPLLLQERKKYPNKADHPQKVLIGHLEDFERLVLSDGAWEIRTFKREYPNRSYTVTPTVIYPEGLTLDGVFKSRSSLLAYLSSMGFTNPLIIDNTCGGIYADSATGARFAGREARAAARGGRKTRRRKSLKRPKVKKLIHFS